MTMEDLIITPRTKVHELLEAYPDLEDALIGMAPVFSKLKNPVLRRTIARVTTLQQAAVVGNISVHELVNTLRSHVGQDNLEGLEKSGEEDTLSKPAWFSEDRVMRKLDAKLILDRGEHPLGQVIEEVKTLQYGEIYELITPFQPIPLIERVMALGFDRWTVKEGEDFYRNYFCKMEEK